MKSKKSADDKVSKNSTDILGLESRLKQKEDTLNTLEGKQVFLEETIILVNSLI